MRALVAQCKAEKTEG